MCQENILIYFTPNPDPTFQMLKSTLIRQHFYSLMPSYFSESVFLVLGASKFSKDALFVPMVIMCLFELLLPFSVRELLFIGKL